MVYSGPAAPRIRLDDERQALRFELAAAYERAGDLDRAKDLFTEVYGVNVSYRGVNEETQGARNAYGLRILLPASSPPAT